MLHAVAAHLAALARAWGGGDGAAGGGGGDGSDGDGYGEGDSDGDAADQAAASAAMARFLDGFVAYYTPAASAVAANLAARRALLVARMADLGQLSAWADLGAATATCAGCDATARRGAEPALTYARRAGGIACIFAVNHMAADDVRGGAGKGASAAEFGCELNVVPLPFEFNAVVLHEAALVEKLADRVNMER